MHKIYYPQNCGAKVLPHSAIKYKSEKLHAILNPHCLFFFWNIPFCYTPPKFYGLKPRPLQNLVVFFTGKDPLLNFRSIQREKASKQHISFKGIFLTGGREGVTIRIAYMSQNIKVSKINNPPNGLVKGGNFTRFSFVISNRGVLRKYFFRKKPLGILVFVLYSWKFQARQSFIYLWELHKTVL